MVSKNSNRQQVAHTAQAMLEGKILYLAGAVELVSLRDKLGIYENDPDFFPFVAIMAELDQLPIGRSPELWSEKLLTLHRVEIEESVKWAKEISIDACKQLIARFK